MKQIKKLKQIYKLINNNILILQRLTLKLINFLRGIINEKKFILTTSKITKKSI